MYNLPADESAGTYSKIKAGRFPDPPRRSPERVCAARRQGQALTLAAPRDISLSGEDEAHPALHFAGGGPENIIGPAVSKTV